MSAKVLGRAVLLDVYTESLADLLLTLRSLHSRDPKSFTGIELLDKIIDDYQSSLVGNSRVAVRNPQLGQNDAFHTTRDPELQYSDDLQAPNTMSVLRTVPLEPLLVNITLAKPGSRSAASHLLNQLTALSTLPYTQGGKQGCVVWIHLSNNFSAKLLYKQILRHLASKHPNEEQETAPQQDQSVCTEAPDDLEAHAKQLLQHVHVIRCMSTRQLLQTLQNLPSYLFDLAENQSVDKPCTLLVIDSINQFYWIDQFDAEIARLQGPGTASRADARTAGEGNIIVSILSELKDLSSRLECPVVYTSHPIQSSTSSSSRHATPRGGPEFHSPAETASPEISLDSATKIDPFHTSALLTLSPVSAAVNVPQFAPQMTIESCVRDQEKRSKAVRESSTRWWFDVKRGGAATHPYGAAREKTGFWMRADSTGIAPEQSS